MRVKGKAEPVAAFSLHGRDRPWAATAAALPARARRAAHGAGGPRRRPRRHRSSGAAASSASPPRPGWASPDSSPSSSAPSAPTVASSPSASARRSAANASYAVWREIWRTLLGVDDRQPEDVQVAALERRLDADRPHARGPGAAARAAARHRRSPTTSSPRTLDPKLRKASLEDLLARCLQARAADEPLVLVLEDCHWIDPLSRDLLEVLVRATRRAAGAVRAQLPAGSRARRRARPRAAAAVHGDRADRARAGGRRAADPRPSSTQLFGAGTDVPGGAGGARHDALPGQPVLRRGAAQLHPRARASTCRTRPRCARLQAPGEPAQPDPEPHRHARRVAAPHAQGRQRGRALVPRARAAGRLSGARRTSTTSARTSAPCAPSISSRSTGRPRRPTSSSTSSRRR